MSLLMGSYSPNDVNVVINGVPVSGFADGTFVKVAYNSKLATMVEGADGTPAVAFKKGNRGATLTFTLLQTSMSNTYLNALLLAQKNAGIASASLSAAVTNSQGGEATFMPRGFFEQEPDMENGAEVGNREWTIIGQIASNFAGFEV